MSTIYRGQFSTLWITLQSNEQLGILDSGYLEDYYGNDGQVTLHHVESSTDYPVLMIEQPAVTPSIPQDVFKGQVSLAGLPNGTYQVRGRCCDTVGNYTILSSVQTPVGDEQILALGFGIRDGTGLRYQVPVSAGLIRLGFMATTLNRPPINGLTLSRPNLSMALRSAIKR